MKGSVFMSWPQLALLFERVSAIFAPLTIGDAETNILTVSRRSEDRESGNHTQPISFRERYFFIYRWFFSIP